MKTLLPKLSERSKTIKTAHVYCRIIPLYVICMFRVLATWDNFPCRRVPTGKLHDMYFFLSFTLPCILRQGCVHGLVCHPRAELHHSLIGNQQTPDMGEKVSHTRACTHRQRETED